MNAELEWFTLDLLDTIGVVLVRDDKIHYVNKLFADITRKTCQSDLINIPYIKAFEVLGEKYSKLLSTKIKESLHTINKQDFRICFDSQCFQVQIVPKDSSSVSILFSILPDENSGSSNSVQNGNKDIVIKNMKNFTSYEPDLDHLYSNTETFKWLSHMNEFMGEAFVVVEYYPELKDYLLVYANSTIIQRWDWDPNTIRGKFLFRDLNFSIEDPQMSEWVKNNHEALLARAPLPTETFRDDAKFTTKDGIVKMLHTRTKYMGYTSRGHPLLLRATYDVTHLKELEAELIDKERKLQRSHEKLEALISLVDNAPVQMGVSEIRQREDGKVSICSIYANPETCRVLKVPPGSLSNTFVFDKYRSDECEEEWKNKFTQSKETGEAVFWETQLTLTEIRGTYLCCAKHIRESKFVWIVENISQTKKLETELRNAAEKLEQTVQARTKQLQEAIEVKSRFLAIMSHEIRTPLNGIICGMNLLSESKLSAEQHDLLRTTLICSEQLLYVINDILDITKMEENKMRLDLSTLSIPDIVSDSLSMVVSTAESKRISLQSWTDPKIPEKLIGDAARLRQILVNLLSNAVKFSYKGQITLRARFVRMECNKCVVECSVKDQGVGISEEFQKKLFQPFLQADSAANRRNGGSGLGLHISKRLTELMEGEMWVESKEGVGSTFYFTVKLGVPAVNKRASPCVSQKQLSKPMAVDYEVPILLAEDNTMNQHIIQKLLKNIGFTKLKIVDNGQEAIEAVKSNKFKIILMDCMMPITSGFEATEVIRKMLPDCEQPAIIALTADAFKENSERCIASGMNEVITKPINRSHLASVLEKYSQQQQHVVV